LGALRRFGSIEVAPQQCDVGLYHVGNNELHAEIYRRAIAQPGVVVLHDAVLHHFLLGQMEEERYVEEFVYNYGAWQHGLARELWRGRRQSGSDERYFAYPMLKRVAEAARAVVVHNPAAARAVQEHAPQARVVELPHLFAGPELPAPEETAAYRRRLGLPAGAFLFGVFGYLRESKRLVTILQAFRDARRAAPWAALLVAGDFVSSDLERAAAPLLAAPGVYRVPYLAEKDFWLAASAVDACISLRFPVTGETSGITVRLMGIGKAVLVSDSLECSRFPEDACLRVATGLSERESLCRHMVLLTSMAEITAAIGERAAAHIREHHRLEDVAGQYWGLLCEYRT
jgi:glycosyltransferase involved in cell wall biosynthesis